jgi:hypothetical protein
MKFTGWLMSAGLVLAASAASAQSSIQQGSIQQGSAPQEIGGPRYAPVSDFEGPGPYAAMPPEAPDPRYGGPMLLPPQEVYTVLRVNRFSPLGVPKLRGFVYVISVVDRTGEDGRLVIDARSGQIIRFMPAHRMGNNFNDDLSGTYGPAGPLPPVSSTRGPPRPPGSVPHVASRAPLVPLPKPPPARADEVKPLAEKPVAPPPQQSAAVAPKPADAQVAPQASAPPAAEAKPAAPQIAPTQEMPKVQGLE